MLGNKSPEQTSTLDTEVLEIAFQTGVHGTINPTTAQKVFNNAPFSKIIFPTPNPNPGYQFKNWTDN
ncbi:MAG: hypothetical protein Q4B28_01395 [bacterium]|nr:hypothetical protein [bacterium]